MKKVLITGIKGYIAAQLTRYLREDRMCRQNYEVHNISVRDENWKKLNFTGYDTLIHTAALVHKKEPSVLEEDYYKVNVLLTKELALKAKMEGIQHFIYFSTLNIYGMESGQINAETVPKPKSLYGKSKYQAEQELQLLADEKFHILIARLPMVYGKGAKGNYRLLEKLVCILPVFPKIYNQKSMLHIERLCKKTKEMMDGRKSGICVIQDEKYICTSAMAADIARDHGKRIWISKIWNPMLYGLYYCPVKIIRRMARKAFGNLTYQEDIRKKALVVSTVSGFVPQFEMQNIDILKNMGFEIHYASNFRNPFYGKDNSRLNNTGILCHQIPFERSPYHIKNIMAYFDLKKLEKTEQFDLVHCHTPVGGAVTRLAYIRKNNQFVIYTAHGFHFYLGAPLKNWIFFYPVEKWLSKYTDMLITMNKEDYRRAKSSFFSKRIEYVPGVGIDLEKIDSVKINIRNKRKELKIPEHSFVIASVGELSKRKNHALVLHALEEIKNKNICYIICGHGKEETKLKKAADNKSLSEMVRFLGYRHDVIEILKAADGFVFPSRQEGLPVALMEAMACGLPVIASDIRGNKDLLEHGKGGFLIRSKSLKEMKDAIENLAGMEKEQRNRMGTYNKQVIRHFSKEKVYLRMSDLYRELQNKQETQADK